MRGFVLGSLYSVGRDTV